jgi:hypothetical protein
MTVPDAWDKLPCNAPDEKTINSQVLASLLTAAFVLQKIIHFLFI